MTLSPYDGPQVRGVGGPEYKVGPICCNPNCKRYAEHAHHIFRRSDQRLGGAFDWVSIMGYVVQNKVGVCAPCHDDLTGRIGGHKAAIRMIGPDFDWIWTWCIVKPGSGADIAVPVGEIQPQPLTPEALADSRATGPLGEPETCPACGHVKRRARPAGLAGRAQATWTVKVPADAENGAEILDTLVDDLALLLGVEPNQTGRYYVLVPCLYYAHQERSRFVESLKGVGA